MKVLVFFATFFLLLSQPWIGAQANCTSCGQTITLNGNSNTGVTINSNNTKLCIVGTGTYSGTVNVNNRTGLSICVGANATFSGTLQNGNNYGNVEIYGTFNTTYTVKNGQNFTVHLGGKVQGSLTLENGSKFYNYGTAQLTNFTMVNGTDTEIYTTGNFSVSNQFTGNGGKFVSSGPVTVNNFNPNNGNYTFNSSFIVNGAMNIASGVTMNLNGPSSVAGSAMLNGGSTINLTSNLTVGGAFSVNGTINAPSNAGSCVALCANGGVHNQGSITASNPTQIKMCSQPTGTGGKVNVVYEYLPAQQATNLQLSYIKGFVTGTFTPANQSPGGYLVLRRIGSVVPTSEYPKYGGSYPTNSYIGQSKVVATLPANQTTFTDMVDNCGNYYYAIFSMSNAGGSCAAYNAALPLTNAAPVNAAERSAAFEYETPEIDITSTNTTPIITGNPMSSTFSAEPGIVFTNPSAGTVDPTNSVPGEYNVIRVIPASGNCPDAEDQFVLKVQNNILPITLVSFEGRVNDGTVQLTWVTASEKNNKGFRVQRSIDGRFWDEVAFVDGHINSNTKNTYSFSEPLTGTSVKYRLVQEDLDGVTETFRTITVTGFIQNNRVKLGQDLGTHRLHLTTELAQNTESEIKLINSNGQVVFTQQLNLTEGSSLNTVEVSESLKGFHMVQLTLGAETKVFRIILP